MSGRFSKLMVFATVGAAVALALSACGGSDSESSAPAEPPAPAAPTEPAEAVEPEPEPVSDAMESGEGMDGEHTDAGEGMDSEPPDVDAESGDGGPEHADGAEGDDPSEGSDDPEPAPDAGLVIEIVGGEPVDGVARVEVKNGERARFTVRSDTVGEVHVHGVDVTKGVGPDADAKFAVKTRFEGIFEIELHGPAGEVEIGKLVIQPN